MENKTLEQEAYYKIGQAVHIICTFLDDNSDQINRRLALKWLNENYPKFQEKYPKLLV